MRVELAFAIVSAASICGLAAAADPRGEATDPELAQLVARIARADDDDAAEAADRLIERMVGPLAAALGDLASRPPEQQRRLVAVLGRIHAALRLRLFRAGLPAEDQQLLDDFARRHGELAEALFHDDPDRRLEAVLQVPLERDSGAGVMIAGLTEDWYDEVLDAALKRAESLRDPVVGRGLARSLARAVALVKSGRIGPEEAEYAVLAAINAQKLIRVLGRIGSRDSVPAIVEAVGCFAQPPLREVFRVAEAFEALGELGDERAVPMLMGFLNDREAYVVRNVAPGQLLQQTAGDAALLALARIYGLPPEQLGFRTHPGAPGLMGFLHEEQRAAALQAFRLWHKENGARPRGERTPLTTQPATQSRPAPGR